MLKELVMLLVAEQLLDPLGQLLELKSVKPLPLLPLLSLSLLAISLLLLLSPASGSQNGRSKCLFSIHRC